MVAQLSKYNDCFCNLRVLNFEKRTVYLTMRVSSFLFFPEPSYAQFKDFIETGLLSVKDRQRTRF